MSQKTTKTEQKIILIVRKFKRPVNAADISRKLGLFNDYTLRKAIHEILRRMCRKGLMVNMGRGGYGLSDSNVSTYHADPYDYARQGRWIVDKFQFERELL